MPWTAAMFKKHVHGLSDSQYERGAAAANAVLERTGDEGKAVRIGIAVAKGKAKRARAKYRVTKRKARRAN